MWNMYVRISGKRSGGSGNFSEERRSKEEQKVVLIGKLGGLMSHFLGQSVHLLPPSFPCTDVWRNQPVGQEGEKNQEVLQKTGKEMTGRGARITISGTPTMFKHYLRNLSTICHLDFTIILWDGYNEKPKPSVDQALAYNHRKKITGGVSIQSRALLLCYNLLYVIISRKM